MFNKFISKLLKIKDIILDIEEQPIQSSSSSPQQEEEEPKLPSGVNILTSVHELSEGEYLAGSLILNEPQPPITGIFRLKDASYIKASLLNIRWSLLSMAMLGKNKINIFLTDGRIPRWLDVINTGDRDEVPEEHQELVKEIVGIPEYKKAVFYILPKHRYYIFLPIEEKMKQAEWEITQEEKRQCLQQQASE